MLKFIYEKIIKDQCIKRRFLCGIFKIIKTDLKIEYYILGMNIAIKEKCDCFDTFYFKTPSIKFKNLKPYIKQIYDQTDKKYDSIYYISVPTGEAFVIANCLDQIMDKNKSSKVLLLLRNYALIQIFNLYYPNIDKKVYKLKNDLNFRKNCQSKYIYKNTKIFIYFKTRHYYKQDKKILNDKNNKTHFLQCIYKTLNINNIENFKHIEIPLKTNNTLIEKIKKINLNTSKFVIFAPEARTCNLYNTDFWLNLEKEFKTRNIDVFWNIETDNYTKEGKKTTHLTYEEFIMLARISKGVVILRSGLADILYLAANTPKYVLYTDFPLKDKKSGQFYTAKKALAGFSLKKYPKISKNLIKEYDTNKLSSNEIIRSILGDIKGGC